MFEGIANAAAQFLAYGFRPPIEDVSQRQEPSPLMKARFAAIQRGWRPWLDPRGGMDQAIAGHEKIWIWRPEWNSMPVVTSLAGMDPVMNVAGLYWKPWRESDVPHQLLLDPAAKASSNTP
jgi:hypothetical protein